MIGHDQIGTLEVQQFIAVERGCMGLSTLIAFLSLVILSWREGVSKMVYVILFRLWVSCRVIRANDNQISIAMVVK